MHSVGEKLISIALDDNLVEGVFVRGGLESCVERFALLDEAVLGLLGSGFEVVRGAVDQAEVRDGLGKWDEKKV